MQYEVVNVMLTVTTYATVSTDSIRQMQKAHLVCGVLVWSVCTCNERHSMFICQMLFFIDEL